jgi:IS5 family transposase
MNTNTKQIEMVSIDQLVGAEHPYRKLKSLLDFDRIEKAAGVKKADTGADGYGKRRLILCLLLQFMEDRSDRETERFLIENVSAKWFCDFSLLEKTPDYSTICVFRNNLGCKRIARLFSEVKRQLKEKHYCSEVFTFVDASALVSKMSVWEERDKAISDGYEKFNNEVIGKYAKDKEVRIGAKSKNKFWIGYKKHTAVDTQSGMITKVAVTKANVTDAAGAGHVMPSSGAVIADKGYVGAIGEMLARGLHPMVILRNNMKDKIRDKDKWLSKLRAPYERTFSKQRKRVRYKGVTKNQAAEFLYAIAYNFRRLLVLESVPAMG